MLLQQRAHLRCELGRDLERLGIPMGFGQGREAGEVCEDESARFPV
jgi:hypothetical protein